MHILAEFLFWSAIAFAVGVLCLQQWRIVTAARRDRSASRGRLARYAGRRR